MPFTPTILLVEDDESNATPLMSFLRKQIEPRLNGDKLNIVWVRTLADALKQAHRANVTLLDLGLPDSDPEGTVKAIPSLRPPVIVLTGNDDPGVIAACMMQNANRVFVKSQIFGLCDHVLQCILHDLVTSTHAGPTKKYGPTEHGRRAA